ncbi:hypothetical protein M0R19_06325 [Candidatus Pacearchaeota archaeon]|jgi:cell division GTPase FtsZ|nr:hypothetical protein [Candidatus Pacearchaeota archaeon]
MTRKRKFNLFGLGEGGSRIADELYKKMKSHHDINLSFINTASQDLEKHKGDNILMLEGEGTGKRIEKGITIVANHSEEIQNFVEAITAENKVHFHMIIACLGGGSGSTIFDKVVESLPSHEKIVAILVLPELSEEIPANPNSFLNLQRIYFKYSSKLSNMIIIDNDELFKSFSKTVDVENYYDKANDFLTHRLDSIFSLDGFTSQTHSSVDNNEIDEVLFSGNGCFKCYSIKFEELTNEMVEGIFEQFIEVDTDIFQVGNWKSAKRVLAFIEYKNQQCIDMKRFFRLQEIIKKKVKNTYFAFSAKISKELDLNYAITIFANGLDLPTKRISKISKEAKRSLVLLREKNDKTKDKEVFKKEKGFNFKF